MNKLLISSYMGGLSNGFSQDELIEIVDNLGGDALEQQSLDVMDSALLGGVYQHSVMDAVVVKHNRLPNKMRALQRALNSSMGAEGSNITVGLPTMGKPRKNGFYATVTANFPFSDGQTIRVVFHAPDGDPAKVDNDDTLISFRWYLNSSDVTAWMSPESDDNKLVDISLKMLGKRVAQLISANSEKYVKRQETLAADRAALATEQEKGLDFEAQEVDLEESIERAQAEVDDTGGRVARIESKIEKARKTKLELEARLESELSKKKELEAEAEEAIDNTSVMGILSVLGLSVLQLAVLFISGTVTAKFRKDEARKWGISPDDYANTLAELNESKKYLLASRVTTAGENLLNRLFGDYWAGSKDKVKGLLAGENYTPSIPEANKVKDRFLGDYNFDLELFNALVNKYRSLFSGEKGFDSKIEERITKIFMVDSGVEPVEPRTSLVKTLIKALTESHAGGLLKEVDWALDFIQDYNKLATKDAIASTNKVWDLRTEFKSIYSEQVGAEYFDWSKEGSIIVSAKEYREEIDSIRWLLNDYAGHTPKEIARANVTENIIEYANKLIARKSNSSTEYDIERAESALLAAVSNIEGWEARYGSGRPAIERLKDSYGMSQEEKISLLSDTYTDADADKETAKVWDEVLEVAVAHYSVVA